MNRNDIVKRNALDRIDKYIREQLRLGQLLEFLVLGKEVCRLSDEEFAEVKTNIQRFNDSPENRFLYCNHRSIEIPYDKTL